MRADDYEVDDYRRVEVPPTAAVAAYPFALARDNMSRCGTALARGTPASS